MCQWNGDWVGAEVSFSISVSVNISACGDVLKSVAAMGASEPSVNFLGCRVITQVACGSVCWIWSGMCRWDGDCVSAEVCFCISARISACEGVLETVAAMCASEPSINLLGWCRFNQVACGDVCLSRSRMCRWDGGRDVFASLT